MIVCGTWGDAESVTTVWRFHHKSEYERTNQPTNERTNAARTLNGCCASTVSFLRMPYPYNATSKAGRENFILFVTVVWNVFVGWDGVFWNVSVELLAIVSQ